MQLVKASGGRTLLVLALAVGAPGLARAGQVELISRVAPDQVSDTAVGGDLSPNVTFYPLSVSADGRYVAFVSAAANLVPGQDGRAGIPDVFLRDRVAGTTVLVSRSAASATVPANSGAGGALVSPDGRFVAWSSNATDVVAGQPGGSNPPSNVFLFDRLSGTNQLVGPGDRPGAFSPDGRFLAYVGTNVFLYDLTAKTVRILGAASYSGTARPAISADGRFIAFESNVSNATRIAVSDRVAGTLEDLGAGYLPSISADGRYVGFLSDSPSRVPGQVDTNNSIDAFLYDRSTHATVLVSRSQTSALQAGNRGLPGQQLAVSPDGRYVAFISRSSDVVPNQASTLENLFLFDRTTKTVKLVASTTVFAPDGAVADSPVFSGDGSALVFVSRALDVVPGQASSGAATSSSIPSRPERSGWSAPPPRTARRRPSPSPTTPRSTAMAGPSSSPASPPTWWRASRISTRPRTSSPMAPPRERSRPSPGGPPPRPRPPAAARPARSATTVAGSPSRATPRT